MTLNRPPDLVIFDWDGTLMDSTARIVSCCQKAALEVNLPVPEAEAVRQIIGLNLTRSFQILFPTANENDKNRLNQSYRDLYINTDTTPSPVFEGAVELLTQLQSNGIKLAVATGKARLGLDRVMGISNLGDFFDDSICADESTGKPHPDMLHILLDRFKMDVAQAVMIGDTEHDLEMAHNAEMQSVGVSHGAHSVAQLKKWKPLSILDHLMELPKVLSVK
jgi:phosphoglycolate phosphatase